MSASTMSMSPSITASATIRQGRIYLHDKRTFLKDAARFGDGVEVVLRLEPAADVRSNDANRRYFAYTLRQILDGLHDAGIEHAEMFTGNPLQTVTTEILHTYFKRRYNNGASTRTLPPKDFAAYTERVMAHAASEWGVSFPPEEPLL